MTDTTTFHNKTNLNQMEAAAPGTRIRVFATLTRTDPGAFYTLGCRQFSNHGLLQEVSVFSQNEDGLSASITITLHKFDGRWYTKSDHYGFSSEDIARNAESLRFLRSDT